MLPIIQIPAEISAYCQEYQDLFTKPQYSHFKRYITGLLTTDKINISAMSRQFLNGCDQSSLNRFLTSADWSTTEITDRRLHLILNHSVTKPSAKGALILDDSLIEKFGPKIEYAGKLYDHAKKRYLDHAHCLVNSLYADLSGKSWPFDFSFYIKKELIPEKEQKKLFKTKIQIGINLTKQAIEAGVKFKFVLFDCWFLVPDMVDFLEEKGLCYISEARRNRTIWNHNLQQYISLGDYIETEEFKNFKFKQITIRNYQGRQNTYRYHTAVYRLKKIGKVRLIFTQKQRKDQSWSKVKVLITNAIDHEAINLIKYYALRWDIEVFHRDEKQSLGLESYSLRSIGSIKKHWCLVLVAYTLLLLLKIQSSQMKEIKTKLKTIGESVRYVKEQVLKNLIVYLYDQFKTDVSIDQILIMFKLCKPQLIMAKC